MVNRVIVLLFLSGFVFFKRIFTWPLILISIDSVIEPCRDNNNPCVVFQKNLIHILGHVSKARGNGYIMQSNVARHWMAVVFIFLLMYQISRSSVCVGGCTVAYSNDPRTERNKYSRKLKITSRCNIGG